MSKRIQTGDTDRIITEALHSGNPASPVTGLTTVQLLIWRESDGQFYDFNDDTFKAAGHTDIDQQMSQFSATNAPGVYYWDFDTSAITNPVAAGDTYHFWIKETSATAKNVPQQGELSVGSWADQVDAILIDTAAIDLRLPSDPADQSLLMAEHAATQADIAALNDLDQAGVQAALTAQGYTAARAPYLDNLDAAISSRAAPGDAMDLVADAVDASALATTAVAEIAGYLETTGPNPHGTGAWDGAGGLTAQEVRDAMKLAPTGGAPAAGSVDQHLDDIEADTAAIEPLVTANLDAAVSSRAAPGAAMTLTAGERTAIDAELTAAHGAGAWTGGGAVDWTAAEKEQIRDALGVAGTKTPASGGQLQDILADASALESRLTAPRAANLDNLDATVSSRAVPGQAMDLVTNALDADAVAASGAQEIRDAILADGTPFNGSDIDAAISSRAAPGDAMDLVTDAVDASALAASAANEIATAVETVQAGIHGAGSWEGSGITAQEVRDAMKLAPTGGAPAAGSVDEHLDDILADTGAMNARIPSDPADESLQQASHATTQAAIAALNDLDQAGVQAALTAQGYTVGRGNNLDKLDAAITTRSSHDAADVDTQLSSTHGPGNWEGGAGLTQQQIRDAMKLAPTIGAPAPGSVDQHLDDLEADTAAMDARLPADPADESLQQASHATTQAAIAALNNLSQAQVQAALNAQGYTSVRATDLDATNAAAVAVNARLPSDPADESLQQASHATTQAAIAALNNLSQAQVQAALNAQGYTAGRAALLDNLDASIASLTTDVSSVQDDTTELLARLTIARAAALDSIPGIATTTVLMRKIATNRLELAEGDPGVWVLYDDDDVSVLLTWQVRDKSGAGIRMDSFIPARKTKAI